MMQRSNDNSNGTGVTTGGTPANSEVVGDLNDSGSDLDALPIEVNKLVLQWIDYFQGSGRPHMERYLSRSTRYMPAMKKILKEQGLPEDLIYIALIESGFSSTAKSSASAVGYWQFIRPTGKHYGLRIDANVDERRDFVRSTEAAADYFKGLYNLFGAWYLAIASYNVGENRVKNVVMKYHTRDFWKLARENKLPDETVNYVPKFLAARLIAKEPEKYGFGDVEYMPPIEFSEVEFTNSIDLRKLATALNIEYDDLRDLNPMYKRGLAPEYRGKLKLRVPKGMEALAAAAGTTASAQGQKMYVADEDYGYYRIRRGDTVSGIASKLGTSQREIMSLNHLKKTSQLIAGHRLRVPAENVISDQEVVGTGKKSRSKKAAADSAATDTEVKKKSQLMVGRIYREPSQESQSKLRKIHIVRRGDTLTEIAHRYQVSIYELARVNQINRKAKIPVGARLEIP
jgi:membrane-bound lytic murein transglycosylase D